MIKRTWEKKKKKSISHTTNVRGKKKNKKILRTSIIPKKSHTAPDIIIKDFKINNNYDSNDTLFILFDIETTGRSVYHDRICQIAARIWNIDDDNDGDDTTGEGDEDGDGDGDGDGSSFNAFMNPNYPMSTGAYKTHHIDKHSYICEPSFKDIITQWNNWIQKQCISRKKQNIMFLAHNGKLFDFKLVIVELFRYNLVTSDCNFFNKSGIFLCDSLRLFRIWYPELKSKSLNNLHLEFFKSNIENNHDAMGDVNAMHKLLQYVKDGNPTYFQTIRTIVEKYDDLLKEMDKTLLKRKSVLCPKIKYSDSYLSNETSTIYKSLGYCWECTYNRRYLNEEEQA